MISQNPDVSLFAPTNIDTHDITKPRRIVVCSYKHRHSWYHKTQMYRCLLLQTQTLMISQNPDVSLFAPTNTDTHDITKPRCIVVCSYKHRHSWYHKTQTYRCLLLQTQTLMISQNPDVWLFAPTNTHDIIKPKCIVVCSYKYRRSWYHKTQMYRCLLLQTQTLMISQNPDVSLFAPTNIDTHDITKPRPIVVCSYKHRHSWYHKTQMYRCLLLQTQTLMISQNPNVSLFAPTNTDTHDIINPNVSLFAPTNIDTHDITKPRRIVVCSYKHRHSWYHKTQMYRCLLLQTQTLMIS